MTETHTPLPWKAQVLETEYDPGVYIVGSNLGGLVCAALPWPTEIDSGDYSRVEANAAIIVQAVNSHHRLIEALEALLNSSGARGVYHASKHFDAVKAAESLLAALKEAGR